MIKFKKIFLNPFSYLLIACLGLLAYTELKLFVQHSLDLSGRPLYDVREVLGILAGLFLIKMLVWNYFSEQKNNNYWLLSAVVLDVVMLVGVFMNYNEIINFHLNYEEYSYNFRSDEYSRIKKKYHPFDNISIFNLGYFLFLVVFFCLKKSEEEEDLEILDN
ncbi:hypothetical protein [Aureispira sp. CCB-E]|uniref:hypothetical protein n=1 Tax=Aureispira sp. CCB-E TaxID=3051121 RepID=UPI002869682C|nr:hypothetical protein [Aureispira sp. CCB-E]WMX13037.1 hypothetical protein QP953_19545 [Aureispira sp. CCB-E]